MDRALILAQKVIAAIHLSHNRGAVGLDGDLDPGANSLTVGAGSDGFEL